ncbi:GSCFA domain-containing protein [Chitinophaga silvisoli]|uniref:GSCFA domain-containing protein n=1 Tax=Chitinophaga silvisoli TaxID=2291814 RepID=A0A3E1NX37_9BACT|nr:GSCFA domain-containing protein [Chitinophaga silvisoli]RFM32496.1 GSCFA domain-containing protein [Chitinophaga silvisoli]
MNFRLTFPVTPFPAPLQYSDRLLLMGSCFAEEIGARLQGHYFDALVNPHGILYNPVSITQSIHTYLDNKIYTHEDLFQQGDLWHSWDHHSRFSGVDPDKVLAGINAQQEAATQRLEELDWLMITLGSAHTYTLQESGKVVGNCHKAPASAFYKKMLTAQDIISALDNAMHRLFFRNRKVKILFTISPVRYVRDGVVENNLSKAILLQAVHHMVNKFDRLFYFPAYELVVDDLRDYRFYKEDLVHPNEMAIDYVWEHFIKAGLATADQSLLTQLAELNRAAAHRPFNPEGKQHQQFINTYIKKVEQLMQQHPALPLQHLLNRFSSQAK